ncbi:glycoside hydrolase family 16 protein [Mucilaginibacter jinjuensis]|uniref:Glycoside hydrolase family 16 protein n=1 Tax=Mucilaginibacter jinjuensis TaxID=1176721 RepID=A0ABY7T2Y3_9SPHI|nr:glycoside hydrolase family 16 protein [Mucilaginibacter jinjuensis]WCT10618.1 glycoside hydrolase family 16 protein [Mucilaginibacter jinjuensis]
MKTNLPKLLPLLAIALIVSSATLPVVKKKKTQPHVKETVVFFDDFSGKTVDRSKWNVRNTEFVVNNEQQAYVDSSATVYITHGAEAEGAQNGALVIKPVFYKGFENKFGKFDFLSGRMDTRSKVEVTYGHLSARMKLPVGDGYWPAFWALGVGKWPDCGEIDIMENVGEGDWVSAAIHGPGYFGETPIVNKVYLKPGNDVSKWHVYSVDWDANAMVFKVDGEVFYRVTRPMIENYGKWAFDAPKYLILNMALGGAYPAKVNGIKSPYNGMSEKVVNEIKAGKAKVLVDWVKVTR